MDAGNGHPDNFRTASDVSGRATMVKKLIAAILAWRREQRRPKCPWCKRDIPRGMDTCENQDCIEAQAWSRIGP